MRQEKGIERTFLGYAARGAPFGPDDGTISPWATVASLPFAPEIVLPAIENFQRLDLHGANPYGYKASFNPTFDAGTRHPGDWVSPFHFGINQGPIVIMIENYRSEWVWALMRNSAYLRTGLNRAGFAGGWLDG